MAGEVGGFDVSIIVCGEDFSSNLAHKDLLEILYLRVPDDYFCSNAGLFALFHIYCVRGDRLLGRELAVEEEEQKKKKTNPPVYTHQKLLFVFS